MPPKLEPTGNPVFDFQYAWRRRAASIQKWLTLSGIFLLLIALVLAFCPGCPSCAHDPIALCCNLVCVWVAGISGGLLLLAGIAWGFFWRNKLRDDFRRAYGADSKK